MTYVGKWSDRFQKRKRRPKKGMSNPTVFWVVSSFLTVVLTVLPTAFMRVYNAKSNSMLSSGEFWHQIFIDNLYAVVITQSVITVLQNYSKVREINSLKERHSCLSSIHLHIGWTVAVCIALIFYIFLYLLFINVSPPWRHIIPYSISGLVIAMGLISVLQISRTIKQIQNSLSARSVAADAYDRVYAGTL